eukprot:Platyproteum_vivax@DN1635_c0_g1_i1.p1
MKVIGVLVFLLFGNVLGIRLKAIELMSNSEMKEIRNLGTELKMLAKRCKRGEDAWTDLQKSLKEVIDARWKFHRYAHEENIDNVRTVDHINEAYINARNAIEGAYINPENRAELEELYRLKDE